MFLLRHTKSPNYISAAEVVYFGELFSLNNRVTKFL